MVLGRLLRKFAKVGTGKTEATGDLSDAKQPCDCAAPVVELVDQSSGKGGERVDSDTDEPERQTGTHTARSAGQADGASAIDTVPIEQHQATAVGEEPDRQDDSGPACGRGSTCIAEPLTELPQCIVRSEVNGRDNNEDSFVYLPQFPVAGTSGMELLAVADGMGGHAYGEHASREALRRLSLSLLDQLMVNPLINRPDTPEPPSEELLSEAIMTALAQASSHLRRMVDANKWGKAGSTVVIALVRGDTAMVANLGDSPLFHYRTADGILAKVTEDHTVAGVLLRAGMITPDMARVHEGRSRLEFYVGCEVFPKEKPIHHVRLAPGDLLLLCSDGVTGGLPEAQIEQVMRQHERDLSGAADELLRASLEVGETDNQTLILWRYGEHVSTERQQVPPSPGPRDKSDARGTEA